MNERKELLVSEDGYIQIDDWHPTLFENGLPVAFEELRVRLDDQKGMIFEFQREVNGLLVRLQDNQYELVFGQDSRHEILVISTTISSEHNMAACEGVLAKSPMIINFESEVESSSGIVLNLNPKFIRRPIELKTPHSVITITPNYRSSDDYSSAVKQKKQIIEVGTYEIVPTKTKYCLEDLLADNALLWGFLRFVSGSHVGLGSWVAYQKNGQLAAIQPEFQRFDILQSNQNWASFHRFDEIEILFALYQTACERQEQKLIVNRAFELYRTATAARNFANLETGVILGQTALELLVDYTLTAFAGWSNDLNNQTKGFHNKLSASAAFIGYQGDLLEHAESVKQAFNKQNKSQLSDFQILTMTRNELTHAKPKVSLKGLELVQVWEASMFLVELHLFFILGYRGKMNDRRRIGGWIGETIEVPLGPNC